jgi:hypothetical protein
VNPVFAIAATLIAVGVGFGIPTFWKDLKEDIRDREYMYAAFDIFVLVVLFAAAVTLIRDMIWRVR